MSNEGNVTTKELNERAKEAAKLAAIQNAAEYLRDHPKLYYVKADDCYWEFEQAENVWTKYNLSAMQTGDARLRGPENAEQFKRLMEEHDRVKDRRGFYFEECPKNVLNELRRDMWLKPAPGRTDNTRYFDYLLATLGDHREANILHLKQVMGWKILHPGDTQLPCLCFHGEGGGGKNVLVDVIGQTIFGAGSTCSVKFKYVERFNGVLAAKLMVNFDESVRGGVNLEALKAIVGNIKLPIERKGFDTIQMPNTALYITSSNSSEGAFRIERNNASRRWSILRISSTLVQTIAKGEGASEEQARELLQTKLLRGVYDNPAEVAHFMHECVEEAMKLKAAPPALHGEDYTDLLQSQAGAEEEVMTEVFIEDPYFEFITGKTLYTLYLNLLKETNPAARATGRPSFLANVDEFLRHQRSDIRRWPGKKQINGQGKQTMFYNPKAPAFTAPEAASGGGLKLKDNSSYYLDGLHRDPDGVTYQAAREGNKAEVTKRIAYLKSVKGPLG